MEVRLVAHTPNPDQVCEMAARTCTSSECPELPTAVNKTRALEHALASGHESVAEHAVFTFQVEGISRACSHQLVRHRLASYSQQSQRYVNMNGFEYVTPKSIQTTKGIIQFRCEPYSQELDSDNLLEAYQHLMEDIQLVYSEFVKCGVPEEDARYILPNACCTNITITMNARELRHFFEERCCSRAQWEIRELAEKMLDEVKKVAPVLFEDAGPKCQRLGYCPEAKGCSMAKERR